MKAQRNNAVQIVLNSSNYLGEKPSNKGFGTPTDFFQGRNSEFDRHRQGIIQQLASIQETLAASPKSNTGYIKVSLREGAWAKSHRPTGKIFNDNVCQSAGADALGTEIFEVSSTTIPQIISSVRMAEIVVKTKENAKTGKEEPNPSEYRSEVGAIDHIRLHEAADRQNFSARQAIDWFQQPSVGQFYVIDIFLLPDTLDENLPEGRRRLLESLITGLNQLPFGVALARPKIKGPRNHEYLVIKPINEKNNLTLQDAFKPIDSQWSNSPLLLDTDIHTQLVNFLSNYQSVRRLYLPPAVQQHVLAENQDAGGKLTLPIKLTGRSYPRVGVIDGGLSDHLKPWILGQEGLLADEHKSLAHGTFIGGLLTAARAAGNTDEVARELDGCELYDLDLFPASNISNSFTQYHPNGFLDFLETLDSAVSLAKSKHNIKIFNLSINVRQEAELEHYGIFAEMLDEIARKNGVIIVISAGNLDAANLRRPWPRTKDELLGYLARHTASDRILQPSESVLAITVAAVNPPNVNDHPQGAPTPYTRRGPGMQVGVKPDFAHYSGTLRELISGHGLYSIDPIGNICTNLGTSFSAPLVAKSLASLESKIAGEVPRELLQALMVHHARVPDILATRGLQDIARQFVGFGIPSNSDEMLLTDGHAITLVFNGTLYHRQQLSFKFTWPKCLVNQSGACGGMADMTLVYSPVIDARYGAEFVRVNVDASLRQFQGNNEWSNQTPQIYLGGGEDEAISEAELIKHGLKWWPVKRYRKRSAEHIGHYSEWEINIKSLVRDGEAIPNGGIPFAVILTISDPGDELPVFQNMKAWLTAHNVNIGDISTALQIRPR